MTSSASDNGPSGSAAPSRALVQEELDRIGASTEFRRSARHLRFLRHLVTATLAGDPAPLREMALGVEVFLRNAARFDPRTDSIVRVEARRLRQKLARYYADEGWDARLEFVLPVGGYRIEFRRRAGAADDTRLRTAIAVFDLADASGDATVAALVRGMSTELMGALTRLNGIRVVAGGALPPRFGGAELRRRARQLGVSGVVSGSVSAADGSLHLELRLVQAADGVVRWARHARFDRAAGFESIEPLARGVIAELQRDAAQRQLQRIRLAGQGPLLGAAVAPEVRERLALARAAERMNSVEGYRKAAQLAEAAIAAAPRYAAAYALLGRALIAAVGLTAVPSQPTMEAARAALQRALELDPELAEAHGDLGTIEFSFDRDWRAAETSMLRALRYAPAAGSAHARYGWALMMNRRYEEARAAYAEALALDPLSLLYRAHQALIDLYAREFEAARRRLDAVLEVAPDHLVANALAAALHLYAGRLDDGRLAYQGIAERFPRLSIGRCGLGQALALQGDRAGAQQQLDWLRATFDAGFVSPYQIAMVHARLGDAAAAIEWLARAAQLRDFNFVCVGVDPAFDALRPLPAFRQLLAGNGFGHLGGE